MGLKALIKYGIEVCFNLHILLKQTKKEKNMYILLTPQYLNYGDHAIAAAENLYLKRRYKDYNVQEFNCSFYQYWPEVVKKRIKKDDILIITGGGYAGDLWPQNQEQLEDVIRTFPENKIIMAPQTLFYKNKEADGVSLFKDLMNNNERFMFIAREVNTYKYLKDDFCFSPERKIFYLPDVVTTLPVSFKKVKREGIAFCIRNDAESILPNEILEKIKASLNLDDKKVYAIKMAVGHVEIPEYLRNFLLKRKFREYYRRKLVITDRLHGMVFCAITRTPCVALDNVSKKVSGVYESIKELSYIRLANQPDEVVEMANEVIDIPVFVREKELRQLRKKILKSYDMIFEKLI